jgi:hypothetical protein
VKNVASQPLTGYLIELVDYPGSQYSLWQDDAIEPIAPGQEKRIQVGNMTVGAVPDYVKIQAAIYADGSTAGIPEKVAQFKERRRQTLQTVRDTIARLQKGTPKDTLLADLKQQSGYKVLTDTAAYLANHSVEETLVWLRSWEKALK